MTGYQNGEPPAYRRLWHLRKRAADRSANSQIDQEDTAEEINLDADLAA